MATEILVDAEFVSRLTSGSYETAIGAVDLAVRENADMFGSSADHVETLATYPKHLIVANDEGGFYRAAWSIDEDGDIQISKVEQLDVPVYEASAVGLRVRERSIETVEAILDGDDESAKEGMLDIYRATKSGVRLTAEGVEDLYGQQEFDDDDWFKATVENRDHMIDFLGAEANRLDAPSPKFESLIASGDADSGVYSGTIRSAVSSLKGRFEKMRSALVVARQVDESYRPRAGENPEALADFVDFAQGLCEAIDNVLSILSDAEVVAEDGGCMKCLARVHDGIAEQAGEWCLATAFAEKLARRFEPAA